MADNTVINPGAAGDTVATRSVTYSGDTAKVQVVGLAAFAGADDAKTVTDVPAGGGVEATALRVTVASDSTGVLSVDDNGGSLTVDGAVTVTNATAANLKAEVTIAAAQTLATVTTVGAVTAITNALPAGANNIGDVDVLTIAAGDNNIGNVDIVTMPNVTLAAGTNTNEVVGDAAHDAVAAGNPVLQGGYASAAAPTGVSADGDAVRAWHLRNGAAATVVTAAGALIGGDATNGLDVDVTRLSALVAGSAIIGKVGIDQTTPGTTNLVSNVGVAAHDAAISGNPVRIGLRGLSADYTAVATGDTVDAVASLLGKQVILPYCLPGQMWSYAAPAGGLVSTTAVTIKAAVASTRNYITHIDVVNSHATISTELTINDGAAGTVLWRGWLQAAGGGYSINFDPPLRGTANTLLEIDEVTATGTAGVLFNCVGFTAAE